VFKHGNGCDVNTEEDGKTPFDFYPFHIPDIPGRLSIDDIVLVIIHSYLVNGVLTISDVSDLQRKEGP
jgi:hypothetical protein